MPMKDAGPGSEPAEIDRFDGGVGWLANPEETMQRASHALAVDGEVWLVDPVDAAGVDEVWAEFGEVAGVVVLLDRHTRDAAALARRHDVSVWVPDLMADLAGDLGARTEVFDRHLADTGYAAHPVVDNRFWREVSLYNGDDRTLVVPEAVGTASYFRTPAERLGVHPALRLTPPRTLARFDPRRILVGHGAGIDRDASAALRTALDGARKRAPHLYARTVRSALPV